MNSQELAGAVSRFGAMMLSCGGEINRVEDSIARICAAYGYNDVGVFAIPRTLIITVTENGVPVTRLENIKDKTVNLDRVARLNALSRFICRVRPDAGCIARRLDNIEKSPVYGRYSVIAAYFLSASAYAMFFGGGINEAAAAGLAGIAVRLMSRFSSKTDAGVFFENLMCAVVMSACAMLLAACGFAPRYDKTIIGALMTLVPGVTLTNGARDFIAGDFFAGTYTLIEALLTALGIAAGVAVTVSLLRGFAV